MTMSRKSRFPIIALTVLGLSACATPQMPAVPSINQNPISISESIERLELYSRPNGMTLSARDQDAVAEFLSAYNRFGDGPLYLNVPGAQSSTMGVQQSAELVRQTMAQMGMGAGGLQTGQYQSNPAAPAPVVVSYRRLKVLPRDCRGLESLTDTHSNRPMASFGCAYYANLGAMIENPRQLLEPYTMGASNAQRRRTVYDKYIMGENPASTQPERQEYRTDDK